jgi:glycosyltransferase involved in cell wall biosynthesis
MAAKISGITGVIRTITGLGYLFSERNLHTRILRPVYHYLQKKADRSTRITIFQNADDYEYFHAAKLIKHSQSIIVKSSGIDLDEFYRHQTENSKIESIRNELEASNKKVVIMIARLVKQKGVMEYLGAARYLHHKYPHTLFLLVGPAATEGRQAISDKLIDRHRGCVKYLGPRSDVPALLKCSDIFVLPGYYREGLPRVLLEAGASALPLVVADVPGCRDVVKDKWNGILVKPRDTQSLIEGIRYLIENENEAHEMGTKNPAFIKDNFSLSIVANAYMQQYKYIL